MNKATNDSEKVTSENTAVTTETEQMDIPPELSTVKQKRKYQKRTTELLDTQQTGEKKELSIQLPPFPLRLPSELMQNLKQSAYINGRSLNSEIITRLYDSCMLKEASHEDVFNKSYNRAQIRDLWGLL